LVYERRMIIERREGGREERECFTYLEDAPQLSVRLHDGVGVSGGHIVVPLPLLGLEGDQEGGAQKDPTPEEEEPAQSHHA